MHRTAFASSLLIGLFLSRPAFADAPVVVVANLGFHSAFWINLHHTLYAAAWAQRSDTGARRLIGPMPAPLVAPLSGEERVAWDAAVDYYDRNVADRDLLTGQGMARIKVALAAEDLARDSIGVDLRGVLERVAPIYRRHFWPVHDKSTRAWIEMVAGDFRTIERDTVPRLETLYMRRWFPAPVRVDVVWAGRAYTSLNLDGTAHATVSPSEEDLKSWAAVEIVLHEVCHELILDTQKALAAVLGDRLKEHGVLWHVVQFYVTGSALRQVLQARGIEYTPYMYSTGLFDRAWSQYRRPIEEHWEPYVRGEITRAQAIERTVAAITGR